MMLISLSVRSLPRGTFNWALGSQRRLECATMSGLRNAPNYYQNRSAFVFYYEVYHGAFIVLGQSKPTNCVFCLFFSI